MAEAPSGAGAEAFATRHRDERVRPQMETSAGCWSRTKDEGGGVDRSGSADHGEAASGAGASADAFAIIC